MNTIDCTDASDEPKRVRINFWVPASLYKDLERVSNRDGLSMSEVIRASLKEYMLRDADIQTQWNQKYGGEK